LNLHAVSPDYDNAEPSAGDDGDGDVGDGESASSLTGGS
jgi:hypothetical protein